MGKFLFLEDRQYRAIVLYFNIKILMYLKNNLERSLKIRTTHVYFFIILTRQRCIDFCCMLIFCTYVTL